MVFGNKGRVFHVFARKLMCRGVDWVQFGSNLGHLNIEFLVWSGLVQFSRRCLKDGGSVQRGQPKQSMGQKVMSVFWQDRRCSISVKKNICIVYHVTIMVLPKWALWVAS